MKRYPQQGTPSGFSLIEVLITMVIVGIGLLAAASLQLNARKTTRESAERSYATQMAQELSERMRGNGDQLALYRNGIKSLSNDSGKAPPAPPKDCAVATNNCTSTELVAYDISQWWRAVNGGTTTASGENVGGLTDPTACLQYTGNCQFTIALAWKGASPLNASGEATSPQSNVCGLDRLKAYDDPDSGDLGDDARLRRLVVVQTYIPPLSANTACPPIN
jgi:type IV pilus assembly protein PilV